MNNLTQRVITAIVMAIIVLACIFGGSIPFCMLVVAMSIIGNYEMLAAYTDGPTLPKKDPIPQLIAIFLTTAPVLLGVLSILHPLQWQWLWFLPVLISMSMVNAMRKPMKICIAWLQQIATVWMFWSMPLMCLLWIGHSTGYAPWLVASLMFMTWSNDIFAYFTGRAIGNRKLAPELSPKKTQEGFVGGVFMTVVTAFCLGNFIMQWPLWESIGLGLVVSITATLGDLVESMWKRTVGLKDSGRILPGHGGVLDRFDGFVFMLPFVLAYIKWVGLV